MAILRPVVPEQVFYQGIPTKSSRVAYGDKVAIIGSFPCVSRSIINVKSYEEAKEQLNIKVGVNDYRGNNAGDGYDEKQVDPNKWWFNGARSLKYLFGADSGEQNVSEAIVCNTSTFARDESGEIVCSTDGTTKLLNSSMNFVNEPYKDATETQTTRPKDETKLDYALSRLKNEDFNILFLAFTPSTKDIEKLLAFCTSEYRINNPIGIIYGYNTFQLPVVQHKVTSSDDLSVIEEVASTVKSETLNKYMDGIIGQLNQFKKATVEEGNHHTIYALVPLSIKLDFEDGYLSPMESAAWYTHLVAGTRVDKSFTNKKLDHVEAINEDLVYDAKTSNGEPSDGYKLVQAGATMFRRMSRSNDDIVCVNSTQPGDGDKCFDLSHLRTTAYIVKKMGLEQYLGSHLNALTYDEVITLLSVVHENMLSEFSGIVNDITYTVQPHGKNCLDIIVTIYYFDILLREEIYVNEVVSGWL